MEVLVLSMNDDDHDDHALNVTRITVNRSVLGEDVVPAVPERSGSMDPLTSPHRAKRTPFTLVTGLGVTLPGAEQAFPGSALTPMAAAVAALHVQELGGTTGSTPAAQFDEDDSPPPPAASAPASDYFHHQETTVDLHVNWWAKSP